MLFVFAPADVVCYWAYGATLESSTSFLRRADFDDVKTSPIHGFADG